MAESKNGQHVVPQRGKWAVRRSGSSRASKTFEKQSDAIDHARDIARNQKTELYIHGRDGRIRARDSYGNDPVRSQG